jgi:hypothetical protein
MNLDLNYAKEHLVLPGEDVPVGLIRCSQTSDAVVHEARGGIQAKVFASQYGTELPDPEVWRQEILKTQHALLTRATAQGTRPE